jgi:pyruvate dehydrogenase E2 component (dihydrolipoamide acetyltransferase)
MIALALPSLGSDMDEGTLVKWLVQPGDAVHKGQIVAVVDTAKAAIDVECWHDGTVQELLVEPGTKMAVGSTMAWLRAAGEATPPLRPSAAPPTAARPMPSMASPKPPPAAAPVTPAGERQRVSPAARRAAQERGIDLRGLRGSGPDGAIGLADLPAAAAPAVPDRAAEMRRVIGAAMSRAKREIPHYYLADDIAFEAAATWLAERNREREPAQRLLPAALLLKAVAKAPSRQKPWNSG